MPGRGVQTSSEGMKDPVKGFEHMNELSRSCFQKDQEGQLWIIIVTQGNADGGLCWGDVGEDGQRKKVMRPAQEVRV